MAFQYLNNIPLEEAADSFLSAVKNSNKQGKTELVPTAEADGRVCCEAVRAKICVPHYHASAMDGIALKAEKTFGATETTPAVLEASDFMVVDTGDPLPAGCDAVVMIEDVVFAEEKAVLYGAAVPWQHIRQIGEDLCAGDMILASHSMVTPAVQGALLASGILEINVFCRPVIGIIPTGDELVLPGSNPEPGDIIEFNSTIFSSMLRKWGCVPRVYPITPDNPELIAEMLQRAARECEGVLLSAGSSAGRDDYSCKCIERVGKVLFHGVAIKPGKPAIGGMIGPVPVLGVPGYPVSAILVLENLFRPVARWLCGLTEHVGEPKLQAVVSRQIMSSLKYREFVRVRLGVVEGRLVAAPLPRGAGIVSSLTKADGVLAIMQNREGYQQGDMVSVRPLRSMEEIAASLVIMGSHDPLIDEAADLLKIAGRDKSVASAHIGSMGGIMALKKREAHMAGIHILGEKTGEYNVGIMRSFFSAGEAVLIRGVERLQGFMVEKGNPKNIMGLTSLRKGIRYVNRQGGSGTRILFDYLCREAGIEPDEIDGYFREEYTHTAVAAQIAMKTADTGMGVYSAAQMYGLDFIPISRERYDFAVLRSSLELPQVQAFLHVLRSSEFSERLLAMGGYGVEDIGTVVDWEA